MQHRGQAQNGELGYGPAGKKSSANPDKVYALEGVHTHQVACGIGHTLFLVRPGSKEVSTPLAPVLPKSLTKLLYISTYENLWGKPADSMGESEIRSHIQERHVMAAPMDSKVRLQYAVCVLLHLT